MTRTIAALAAVAMLLTAAGQSLARDDAALNAAAAAYVRHPVVQKMFDDMWSVDSMRSAVVAQLQAHGKNLRDDQVEILSRIVHEELNRVRPRFETLMTKVVVETFALEEIRALNRFLDTKLGGRAMAKTGGMMRSFYAAAGPMLGKMSRRVVTRVEAELSE